MAPASGRDTASLRDQLFEQPARFHFFQIVRLLQRLRPNRALVGTDADPRQEAVRFRSATDFVFPPGDVASVQAGTAESPDEVLVNFMGIASPGSFGSLPVPYTEEIHRQEREHKNSALRDFFDLFNHRFVSLFFRAWARTRLEVLHDLEQSSPYEAALRAMIGVEGDGFRDRTPLSGIGLLSRAGLLAMTPAPAVAIESLLESVLEVRARIEQFVPAWYEIDGSDLTRLGAANSTLGADLNIGSSIRLSQPTFRVRVGPMRWARYQELLPGTEGFRTVSKLVRLAAGVELDFQVQLVLAAEDVPGTFLGEEGAVPARLGRTTWLKTEDFEEDVDDGLFEPAFVLEHPRGAMEASA